MTTEREPSPLEAASRVYARLEYARDARHMRDALTAEAFAECAWPTYQRILSAAIAAYLRARAVQGQMRHNAYAVALLDMLAAELDATPRRARNLDTVQALH